MIVALMAVLLLGTASAFNNTPPIPETRPGWREGLGKLKIEIELFSDLLCDGCAMLHPEFEKFLDMDFAGRPARD